MDNDNFGKLVFFGFILLFFILSMVFCSTIDNSYMVCPNCTNECYENMNYNFCPYCGERLERMDDVTKN